MAKKPQRFRSALEESARTTAQLYANRLGEPYSVYRVQGGYEARPKSDGPPLGSNTFLKTYHRQPKWKEPQRAATLTSVLPSTLTKGKTK